MWKHSEKVTSYSPGSYLGPSQTFVSSVRPNKQKQLLGHLKQRRKKEELCIVCVD